MRVLYLLTRTLPLVDIHFSLALRFCFSQEVPRSLVLLFSFLLQEKDDRQTLPPEVSNSGEQSAQL